MVTQVYTMRVHVAVCTYPVHRPQAPRQRERGWRRKSLQGTDNNSGEKKNASPWNQSNQTRFLFNKKVVFDRFFDYFARLASWTSHNLRELLAFHQAPLPPFGPPWQDV